MTIYQIDAFLTLAAMLNYTKASEILHTTQPNLSKIVVNIEQEVGVQLLQRNRRDVKLTPAGEAFCREIRKSMEHYQKAIERAREVNTGIRGSIDIGFLGTAVAWLLPDIVNQFRKHHPNIRLNLYDYTYSHLTEALSENSVNIALLPERDLNRIPRLAKRFLFSDDMCLVANKNRSWANQESIDLRLIKDEPFVMMDSQISIRDFEMVTAICVEHDFIPTIACEANTLNNLILMVECDAGVAILARHMVHFASKNVRFIRINGYENYFRVVCAWRENINPCVPHFLAIIDEVLTSAELTTIMGEKTKK